MACVNGLEVIVPFSMIRQLVNAAQRQPGTRESDAPSTPPAGCSLSVDIGPAWPVQMPVSSATPGGSAGHGAHWCRTLQCKVIPESFRNEGIRGSHDQHRLSVFMRLWRAQSQVMTGKPVRRSVRTCVLRGVLKQALPRLCLSEALTSCTLSLSDHPSNRSHVHPHRRHAHTHPG